jgi:alpha-1,2-mannosyltransferase
MPATVGERTRPAPDRRTVYLNDLRISRGNLVRLGIVAVAVIASIRAVVVYGRHYTFFDLKIYHGAMVWWTHGGNLYDFVSPGTTLGFTYPPFAALAMAPMAILPTLAAGWVNLVISLAALTVLLVWLLVPIADRHGWPRWFTLALAVPLAAATEPVRETLGFGQVNLLLALLIYADFLFLRTRARRAILGGDAEELPAGLALRLWQTGALAGAGVGLATATKLTPAVFIVYFVVTKQWRAAATAVATALGVTAMTFVIGGRETVSYFTSVVLDTSRVGEVDATANQSLAGVLARLYDSPTTPTLMWLSFAVLVLAVGLIRAKNAHSEGDELTAFTLVGLAGNAICPISWTHHLVFLIPALVILADTALRRRAAARGLASRGLWTRGPVGIPALAGLRHAVGALAIYLLFVVSPIWRYEHKLPKGISHYADGRFGALAENSLALVIIALVVFLPWRPAADPAIHPEPALARRVRAAMASR